MPADGTKYERTAKTILQDNAELFAERDRVLSDLARNNPYRHLPNKRTWQDWRDIHAQTDDLPVDDRAATALLKALRLSTSILVLEALLAGQGVPLEQLHPGWAKAYGYR